MIKVTPLNDTCKDEFCRLFGLYYRELDCDDDVLELTEEYILPDLLAGLIKIDMLSEGGDYIGFIVYQLDDIDNEWCLKEGWGNIREIFVEAPNRGKGYGRFLLFTAEMKLRESGAEQAYCLPYERAEAFFTACGYEKTDEYNEELDCRVFRKADLSNRCRK